MRSRRLPLTRLLPSGLTLRSARVVMLLAPLAPLGGCSSLHRQTEPAPQVRVESEDPDRNLTPGQKRERFEAAFTQGLSLSQRGEYATALAAFERAQKLQPDCVEALFNLGACYEAIGDPAAAMDIYRRVLRLRPNDPDCYRNLGTSFIKMYYRDRSPGWKKMAENAWRRSLELQPAQPDVQKFLAQAQREHE